MRLQDVILRGTAAAQPAATTLPAGSLYFQTDTGITQYSDGATWSAFSPLSSLPTLAQGDILYGSGAGIAAALAKSASASRYLSNTGASNNPAWAQVNLANGVTGNLPAANLNSGTGAGSTTFWRGDGSWAVPPGALDGSAGRVGWLFPVPALGPASMQGCGVGGPSSAGTTPVTADTSVFTRQACTTSASTNNASSIVNNINLARVDEGIDISFIVETQAASLPTLRYFIGLSNASTITADNPNEALVAFRYSTSAPDAGWIGYCATSNVAFTASAQVAAIAAGTVYTLRIRIPAGGANVNFSVNGGAEQQITTNIPLTTSLTLLIGCSTLANVAATLYFHRMFYSIVSV